MNGTLFGNLPVAVRWKLLLGVTLVKELLKVYNLVDVPSTEVPMSSNFHDHYQDSAPDVNLSNLSHWLGIVSYSRHSRIGNHISTDAAVAVKLFCYVDAVHATPLITNLTIGTFGLCDISTCVDCGEWPSLWVRLTSFGWVTRVCIPFPLISWSS